MTNNLNGGLEGIVMKETKKPGIFKRLAVGGLMALGLAGAGNDLYGQSATPGTKRAGDVHNVMAEGVSYGDQRDWLKLAEAPAQYQVEYGQAVRNGTLSKKEEKFVRTLCPVIDFRPGGKYSDQETTLEQKFQRLSGYGIDVPEIPRDDIAKWIVDQYSVERDKTTEIARLTTALVDSGYRVDVDQAYLLSNLIENFSDRTQKGIGRAVLKHIMERSKLYQERYLAVDGGIKYNIDGIISQKPTELARND